MTDHQNINDGAVERNYIAFISYRHKPLDKSIAQKLHQRIERYTIPKEMRKEDGKNKLGLVFRDQDELPISSNLSDTIYYALDHSEYLIVVCSPDTPESLWVQREITYFLEHHDRDHLLAILVDGEPEQSFPPQLTEVRDPDGNIIDRVEPLAANIVAGSDRERNRLFNTESLRLLASLIGCPYDALYHREQRYQIRRLMTAGLIAAVVAAGFIGMLLNRNHMIQEQLYQSMINESKALSSLSESAFRDGDYRGALNNALDALPGRNPKRPYYADAEKALSSALYLYRGSFTMRYIQSFEQNTEITATAISQDRTRFATADSFGNLHVSDMESGQLLWTAETNDFSWDLYFIGDLLFSKGAKAHVYSAEGEQVQQPETDWVLYVGEENGIYLCSNSESNVYSVMVVDIKSGSVIHDLKVSEGAYISVEYGTVSQDGRFAAVLATNPDNEKSLDLFLFDLESGKRKKIHKGLLYDGVMTSYTLDFDARDNLVVTVCGRDEYLTDDKEWKGNCVMLFDGSADWMCRFTTYLDFGSSRRFGVQETEYMDFIDCTDSAILMASLNRLIGVDSQTGKIIFQTDLPDRVKNAKILENLMFMILGNGLINACNIDTGYLSTDLNQVTFDCQHDLYTGALTGNNLKGLRFAVVPSDYRSRASIVAFSDNTDLERPAWMEPLDGTAHFFVSPSGTKIAAVCKERDSGDNILYFNDLSGDQKPVILDKTGLDALILLINQHPRTALTDTGKLILGDRCIDFESGAVTGLTESGSWSEHSNYNQWSASCTDKKTGRVITASIEEMPLAGSYQLLLWEDGKRTGQTAIVPVEKTEEDSGYLTTLTDCICRGISAEGYVVVCSAGCADRNKGLYALYDIDQDTWIPMDYMSTDKSQILELAEGHPWIAFQKEDRNLSIVDFTSGKELITLENTLPADEINRLLFARDDELLMAFTGSGALTIYDTKDGKELQRSYYNGEGLRFEAEGHYEVHYIPEDNRILVIYDNVSNSVPAGITLDAGSLKKTGFYPGVSCYFPEDNTVLIKHVGESPWFEKLFTLEEMQEKAEVLLNGSVEGHAPDNGS